MLNIKSKTKRIIAVCFIAVLVCSVFTGSALADTTTNYDNPLVPINVDTSQLPKIVPWEDDIFGNYLYVNPTTLNVELDIWEVIQSTLKPYKRIVGTWLMPIFLALYFLSLWFRSRGLEIFSMMGLIVLALTYSYLDGNVLTAFIICIGIGISQIVYRIFKRRG